MNGRSSSRSSLSQNIKIFSRMKRFKVSVAFSVLALMYIVLFAIQASTTAFLVVGGLLGLFSTTPIVIDGMIRKSIMGSTLAMLFWRSICDFGLSLRFVLTPAFNYHICHAATCHRDSSHEDKCGLSGAVLQFFLLASELWFLCNGIDLFYSITNPFSSLKTRIKYYHTWIWAFAGIVSFFPSFVDFGSGNIYGFWYVNEHITDGDICWLRTGNNKLGLGVWAFFLVPLGIFYTACLISLIIGYVRLRRGLNRTFLPKMKLLVNNTINVLVLTLFWGVLLMLYAVTFFTRNESPPNHNLNSLLYFTLASKGFSSLFIWIFINDYNLMRFSDQDETVDTNVALREEVLTFTTAGIRSAAKGGDSCTPDRVKIVRRPEHGRVDDSKLITVYFYLKFLLGYPEEIRTVEKMIMGKKRNSVVGSTGAQSAPEGPSSTSSEFQLRMSQRPTVHAGSALGVDRQSDMRKTETGGEHSMVDMVEVASFPRWSGLSKRPSVILTEVESNKMSITSSAVLGENLSTFRNTVYNNISNVLTGETWDTVEFTEFHPFQFRRIRLSVGLTDELFASAFSTTLKERLTEGGASGAFFFFSKGENFIAKSCTEEEVSVLRNNAEAYATYLTTNPSSYISKVLGLYQLKIYGNKLNFIVMNNLFHNDLGLSMNEKYDIKGSWVARNAKPPVEGKSFTCSYCEQKFVYRKSRKLNRMLNRSKQFDSASRKPRSTFDIKIPHDDSNENTMSPFNPDSSDNMEEGLASALQDANNFCPYTVSGIHEPNIILKDNDLKFKIRLPLNTALDVLKQLRKDAEFLSSLGIMDYSLLLGVHNTEYEVHFKDNASARSRGEPSSSQRVSVLKKPIANSYVPFKEMIGDSDASPSPSISSAVDIERGPPSDSSAPQSASQKLAYPSGYIPLAENTPVSLTRMLEVSKVVGPDLYFMGIIDFQQRWNLTKQWERYFKTKVQGKDSLGLSAIEPEQYKERFLCKLEDIIDADPSPRPLSSCK